MRVKIKFRSALVLVAVLATVFTAGLMFSSPSKTYAQGANDGANGAQDVDSPTLSCEILSANPINWFICPLVTGLQESVNGLNGAIDAMMTIDTSGKEGTMFSEEFHNAWGQFRLLAIGIVVIAGLLMLAGQAFNLEFVDAYTVRKMLPRLLIVLILIPILWPLLKFGVQLTNDLGNSIRGIIYAPFRDSFGRLDQSIALGNWTTFVAGLVGGAGIVTLGIAALGSFILTAALAVLIAFLVLLIRQLLLIFLVIISPIPVALWVVPFGQGVFKVWKDAMISLLMLFPAFSALIAVGRVFAVVSYQSGQGAGATVIPVLAQLMAFISFFGVYFLFPWIAMRIGGFAAALTGMINDRGKGGFDRLKNFRTNKRAYNMERMKAGERFNGRNALTRGFNNTTARVGVKNMGFGRQGKAAYTEKMSLLAAQHAKSDHGQAAQFNDNLLRAQSYASEGAARRNMARDYNLAQNVSRESDEYKAYRNQGYNDISARERVAQDTVNESIAEAKANGGFGKVRQVYATKQLAATGTGYDDVGQMMSAIARASNGRQGAVDDMVGGMRGAAKQSGRVDLGGAGHGTMSTEIKKVMNQRGNATLDEQAVDKVLVEAARSTDNATIVRGKPGSTAQLSGAISRQLQRELNTVRNGDENEAAAARVQAVKLTAKAKNMEGASMYGHEMGTSAMYEGKNGSTGLGDSQVQRNIQVVENITRQTVRGSDGASIPNFNHDAAAKVVFDRERQRGQFDQNREDQ